MLRSTSLLTGLRRTALALAGLLLLDGAPLPAQAPSSGTRQSARPASWQSDCCPRCKQFRGHCRCQEFGYPPATAPFGAGPPAPTQRREGIADDARTEEGAARDRAAQPPAETPPAQTPPAPAPVDLGDGLQDFTDPSGFAGLAMADVGAGLNTPMLGRADAANRKNLFDGMSAAPVHRVWFGYQTLNGFNNGIVPTANGLEVFEAFDFNLSGSLEGSELTALNSALESAGQPTLAILERRSQALYRYGVEALLDGCTSLTLQGQYHTVSVTNPTPDDFDNPQIILKRVISQGCGQIISALAGLDVESGHRRMSIAERTTRLNLGLLALRDTGGPTFSQAGIQLSTPLEESQVHAVDWALSIGRWLTPPPSQCALSHCSPRGQLWGIAAQLEFLGHHALSDTTVPGAFGLPTTGSGLPGSDGSAIFVYEEPANVIDLTIGFQFYFTGGCRVAVGASYPVTDDEVRRSEFLSSVSYLY